LATIINDDGYIEILPSQASKTLEKQSNTNSQAVPTSGYAGANKVQIYQYGGRHQYSTTGDVDLMRYADLQLWYFTPMLGQPRMIDVGTIKQFGNTNWVSQCVNVIIEEVVNSEWSIIPTNEFKNDTIDESKKEFVEDFFNNPTSQGDDLGDILAKFLWDYLVIGEGVFVKVFSEQVYKDKEVKLKKQFYKIIKDGNNQKIKPTITRNYSTKIKALDESFISKQEDGQRVGLLELRPYDAGTFVINPDTYGNLPLEVPAFFQYSWRNPRMAPKPFFKREVIWFPNQPRSDTLYGRSPIMNVIMLLETLNSGTRWNKLFFENNAMPDSIVPLVSADEKTISEANSWWRSQFKGRPHRTLFFGDDHKVTSLNLNNRDMEWLEGQNFYMKLVMATYHVTSDELGFTDTSNRSVGVTQSRVFVRKAIKPLLRKLEELFNTNVIPEFYDDVPEVQFKFHYIDEFEKKLERENEIIDLKNGVITINEVRAQRGLDEVEWGDEPYKSSTGGFGGGFMPTVATSVKTHQKKRLNLKKQFNSLERAKEYLAGMSISQLTTISVEGTGTLKQAAIELLQSYKDKWKRKPKPIKEKDYKSFEDYLNKVFDNIESDYLKLLNREKDNIKNGDTQAFLLAASNVIGMLGLIAVPQINKFTNKAYEKGVENAEADVQMNLIQEMKYQPDMKRYAEQIATGYTLPDGTQWSGIKGVSKKLNDRVVDVINTGIDEGYSISRIRDNLVESLRITRNHATMIARTETNRIINQAQLDALIKSGAKVKKQWLSQIDNRTSPICRALNGQTKELGESFEALGQEFMTPPAHVNCRSTFKKVEVKE